MRGGGRGEGEEEKENWKGKKFKLFWLTGDLFSYYQSYININQSCLYQFCCKRASCLIILLLLKPRGPSFCVQIFKFMFSLLVGQFFSKLPLTVFSNAFFLAFKIRRGISLKELDTWVLWFRIINRSFYLFLQIFPCFWCFWLRLRA